MHLRKANTTYPHPHPERTPFRLCLRFSPSHPFQTPLPKAPLRNYIGDTPSEPSLSALEGTPLAQGIIHYCRGHRQGERLPGGDTVQAPRKHRGGRWTWTERENFFWRQSLGHFWGRCKLSLWMEAGRKPRVPGRACPARLE